MSLELQIMEQLKEAMKAKDEAKLRSLRAIKAAIILAKTSEGAQGAISSEEELKMLQKLVKQRKDSYDIFTQQGRADLAAKEAEEIAIIQQFLPQPLDEAALKAAIQEIITAVGATQPADMGKVMGAANKQLAGKADGKTISAMVKTLLSNS